jgi:hypothetical protein
MLGREFERGGRDGLLKHREPSEEGRGLHGATSAKGPLGMASKRRGAGGPTGSQEGIDDQRPTGDLC